MKISKLILWAVGIVFVGYVLWVGIMVFSPIVRDFANRTEFDSEKWKNWEESEMELTLRWDMVSDLTSDYDLKGMSVKKVEELMGKPDQEYKDGYAYYLGLLGIDTSRLFLTVKNGVVTDYKVSRG
ncbi:MAG: hypothetical protein ACQEWG_16405 [Bacteroidota bacterium]